MFQANAYPNVLVGLDQPDDAAVYALDGERALIFTCDFFPPIVDDPYSYGMVAAANAVSDVYAMGGDVLLALNIAVFPECLPDEAASAILRGGADKMRETGGALAGGHTIDGPEPLYGMAVIGMAPRDKVWTKGGAQPGDAIVITKPLGVGLVTTAAKSGEAELAHLEASVRVMATLNRAASELARRFPIHAGTDITGFSLVGHACEVAERSSARLRFHFADLPLVDGAVDYANGWLFPAGTSNNESAFSSRVTFADTIPEEMRLLLFTPETSGGLMLVMPEAEARDYVAECQRQGISAWRVGEVIAGEWGVEVAG
jgi:selenide,water dikinase